jgi:hypothetical protein
MLTLGDRLCPNSEEVASQVMDGEAIMINLSNGMYYSMDGVGGFIWGLIEEARSLREIAEQVVGRYDVASAEAKQDLERLAAELLADKLVLVVDGPLPAPNGTVAHFSGEKLACSRWTRRSPDSAIFLGKTPPIHSLMPVPAIPWIKARWKQKNIRASGSITTNDIAITSL